MRSIFAKLLTGYIALTVSIVILTALVSFFLVRQYTLNTNRASLSDKAETLAEMLGRPGGSSWTLNSSRLADMLHLADANLSILYPDMSVKQPAPRIWPEGDEDNDRFLTLDVTESLDAELLARLLGGESITDVRKLDFLKDEVVFAGAPVLKSDDTVSSAVLLYRPLRQVASTTYMIAVMHAAAGVLALAIAIVIAYIMGRLLSNPLVEMNKTAKHIAGGHYGEQVEINTLDEVGQLGETLNALSGHLAVVIQDLSDQKLKLEQILTSIGDGIIAIDSNGHAVHHNPAALHLLDIKAWGGEMGSVLSQMMAQLNQAMTERRTYETTFSVPGRTISALCSPILSQDGDLIGAVCLLHDISQAQRLEQMRRDYIANISHELRTPLTGIRGMVEPLIDGYIDTEKEKQDCYLVIYQETRRLDKLIGEMLDLSRLQEGRIQMDLEPMDAPSLLRAAARRLVENAKAADVELRIEGEAELTILGNENRIIQVLIILMDNALSFTKPGGRITLAARHHQDGFCALSVQDTGAGIAKQDLPYIWERFYKADRSRLRTQGVGLGLPIAKLIVELMGGQIHVKTELGVGSEFTFTVKEAS